MNLFFIHTPFQLFVVNQIIKYKQLQHNVALFGFPTPNSHFYRIYDSMLIDGEFDYIYHFDDLPNWANLNLHAPFTTIRRIRKNYMFLSEIIDKHQVDAIYIGDIDNFSNKFSSVIFAHKGIRVNFYEEGSSHYYFMQHVHKYPKLIEILLCFFYDHFLYEPVFGLKYAKWCFVEDLPWSKLKITKRYSIIDCFHESFDEILPISVLFPKKVKRIIHDDMKNVENGEAILYVSSPLYEVFDEIAFDVFFSFMEEYLDEVPRDTNWVIKYHPRDSDRFKHRFEKLLESKAINYVIIGKEFNIPLEYYLLCFKFKKMITFISSASMYNGYIYDKIPIEDLALDYYMKCKAMGVKNVDLFIESYKTISKLKNPI